MMALVDADDIRRLIAGVRLVDRLAMTAPLRGQVIRRLTPNTPDLHDDTALEAWLRADATTCYHACGTCGMGPDARTAVVDHRLQVYGIAGLRVVDASVMPFLVASNTNVPVMTLAERASALITRSVQ